ncbi:MAG TPA: ATP-dependent RNA helicase RhlB, partial [Pseudomonas sp.]|nr:ATP-dependent RNA helicase RhlB [Pseudomonas sp.]
MLKALKKMFGKGEVEQLAAESAAPVMQPPVPAPAPAPTPVAPRKPEAPT